MSNILVQAGPYHNQGMRVGSHTKELFKKALESKDYEDPHSFIRLPSDEDLLKEANALIAQKKRLAPALVVVVGIGGSNLGTQAVYDALQADARIPLYFADTVDGERTAHLMGIVAQTLHARKKVLLIGISKSGSTTETIANFECFLAVLQHHDPHTYHEQVVIITDKDSRFWQFGQTHRFDLLAIPAHVGGRFSVLSAVGLFPLGLAGIDIEQLRTGADAVTPDCLSDSDANPAAVFAEVLAAQYAQGIRIHDLFIFNTCLESLGKWQRQLVGESLGKPSNSGTPMGITPTVSVGSTDLHSVGQLYLGGPRDRVTTFVWIEKDKQQVIIPNMPEFDRLVPHIQGKSLHTIMKAIYEGTRQAYANQNLAYMTITMAQKNAFYIGQFLQMQMIATVYLGALMKVNSFDQPQVELYKQKTREILAHE